MIPGKIQVRNRWFRYVLDPERQEVFLFDEPGDVPCAGTLVPAIVMALYDDRDRQGLDLPEAEKLTVFTVTQDAGQVFVQYENAAGAYSYGGANKENTARAIQVREQFWPGEWD